MNSVRVPAACFVALSCALAWAAGCSNESSEWTPTEPQSSSSTPPPDAPPTQPAVVEPPALSGGTLLVLQDGTTAVAADPDRDVVWIVDLATQALLHEVTLQPGDEPGRVAEDGAGHVHVALRRGGALVSIDPATGLVVARRRVCPAPRGVAYDASIDSLYVACMDGRLVTLPADGGAATRTVHVDTDLRDVVLQRGQIYVTRFRAAELLQLAADGTVAQRITLPVATNTSDPIEGPPGVGGGDGGGATTAAPSVAYRTVALPGGGLAMLHQRAQQEALSTDPGGYSSFGPCPGAGIVHDAVTIILPGTAPAVAPPLGLTTLAVDLAVSPDGTQVAVSSAGSPMGSTLSVYPLTALEQPGPCALPSSPMGGNTPVSSVAFDAQGHLVALTRDPLAITVGDKVISLPGASVTTPGFTTFHTASGKGSIACASCHPEGGDDGRVWQFSGLGERRTQNLRGGVLARAPFHWSGDIADMDALVTVVLVGRMDGQPLDEPGVVALGHWMDAQPALLPPTPADVASVARGATLFGDPALGCTTCHNGPQLSNHQLVDVGTGATFKVPSLIAVGYRAPYLHDGCAATLQDRFDPTCGGGDTHGHTSQLTAAQIGDLVAYLQSL